MNTAQKNLIELKNKIPIDRQHEHDYLNDCIKVWNGYTDMQYSTPEHQLNALTKKYGLTVWGLNRKYNLITIYEK